MGEYLKQAERSGQDGAEAAHSPAPARILLAEDSPSNRMVTLAMLRQAGYEVTAVAGGTQAVYAVAHNSFDLVLMDIAMPGMDGLEAAREIRRLPGNKARIPIIALTGSILEEDMTLCQQAGMNDTLGKPFRRTALLALIAHWLKKAPLAIKRPDLGPAAGYR